MLAAIEEISQDLLALGIADLLQDDLLGRLGADTTKVNRLQRFLEEVARLDRKSVV